MKVIFSQRKRVHTFWSPLLTCKPKNFTYVLKIPSIKKGFVVDCNYTLSLVAKLEFVRLGEFVAPYTERPIFVPCSKPTVLPLKGTVRASYPPFPSLQKALHLGSLASGGTFGIYGCENMLIVENLMCSEEVNFFPAMSPPLPLPKLPAKQWL